jgi:hypothetical protein
VCLPNVKCPTYLTLLHVFDLKFGEDHKSEAAKCDSFYPALVNLLNPTGHVTHQQFNIQQLYVLPTLYLCVLYLSENKQRIVPLTA